MDTPGSHVGGHQSPDLSGPEGGQGPVPLRLAMPAVDGGHRQPAIAELAGQAVGTVLGAHKNDRGGLAFHHFGTGGGTFGGGHGPEAVCGPSHLFDRRDDLVPDRLVLVVADEGPDRGVVEGGREQHGLAPGVGGIEDTAHGRQEAHVGHPVRLVDHDDIDVGEDDLAHPHEVLQPAGTGDDNVNSPLKGAALGIEGHPSEDGVGPQVAGGQEGHQLTGDLGCELPGRRQYQAAGALGYTTGNQRRHGKCERQRLARPGGRHAGHVPALEGVGDDGGLHG